jgi:transcriptional regulator with XRE-family HTH domain
MKNWLSRHTAICRVRSLRASRCEPQSTVAAVTLGDPAGIVWRYQTFGERVSDSKTLVTNLKARLRADGMSYRQLAAKLGLSEPTIKRDLSRGTFSLDRLDRICAVLDVSLLELLQPRAGASLLTEFSAEQERALVASPKLLLVTYLIVNDWKFGEIVATFQIGESELIDLALKLEKLRIVEFKKPNRLKKLTARNFSWRKDGPVHAFFLERVAPEFFHARFDGPSDEFRFIAGTLSSESRRRFKAAIERLAAEFEQLAHNDARLPLADRDGCSAILALRSWEFSGFTRLRRAKR